MGEIKLAYKILFGKPEVKTSMTIILDITHRSIYIYIFFNFRKMDRFPSSRIMRRVPAEVSPLERASLIHWTQQEVLSSTGILLTSSFIKGE